MIKVETIQEFTFARFDELKNIKRKSSEVKGKLFVGDIFECTKEIANYLLGDNSIKKAVVKVIEIIPEQIKEEQNNVEFHKELITQLEKENKKSKSKKIKIK